MTGIADFRGDGEHLMKIRRFIPDFISQTGVKSSLNSVAFKDIVLSFK